jgi:hypothetical protein
MKLLPLIFLLMVPMKTLQAQCLQGPGIHNELKKINTSIVVGLVGYPIPPQMLVEISPKEKILDKRYCLSLAPKPIKLKKGSEIPLLIEWIDSQGKRHDITSSPFLNIHVSAFNIFYVTPQRILVIKPDPKLLPHPNESPFMVGSVEVEYVTTEGKIGFNGFAVEIQP